MLIVALTALLALDAPAPAKPLKVLVLDVDSADLSASEKTTLTNLEAAHLGEDARLEVLSGEDLRELVKLQGQAQDIGVSGACTDACMAELAGALGAGVVVATQAGKLGDTFVVTLAVFDAAKAKSVSRRSIQAQSIGELPTKVGPTLDALMRPLLPTIATAQPTSTAPPPPQQTTGTTSTTPPTGRVRELLNATGVVVCVDKNDATAWWFCDVKRGIPETEFVARYQELTGAHDLDKGGEDASDIIAPVCLFSLSALGLAGVLVVATTTDSSSPFNINQPAGVAVLTLGVLSISGGITGGVLTLPGVQEPNIREHKLTEGEGRAAVDRYNTALRAKIERDLGGGGGS